MTWERLGLALLALWVATIIMGLLWWRRSAMSRVEAVAYLKAQGIEVARLPRRLRRVANDPRTPLRARWWLSGLAVYIASPLDLIPDFIPIIGLADELVIVLLVLRHVRRMIPDEVWLSHFPPRSDNKK